MEQTMVRGPRSGWREDEIDQLWREIQRANASGQPLRSVFEEMGGRLGRKPNNMRNYYYMQLRGQHGDRYADLTQSPAWAFGEGRSYSTVEYSHLRLETDTLGLDDDVVATVTLTNTGERPAREVVQAYVRDEVTSVSWADRELKAWELAWVQPGESIDVTVRVPVTSCSIVNARSERVVEPGDFSLLVGPSSRIDSLLSAHFSVDTAS